MRRYLIASLTCAALLIGVGVGTVGAANVTGTPGGDELPRLRQRRQALRAGRKRQALRPRRERHVVGGPGNDLVVGGPGADRLMCGPGRDTASGDAKDKVAKDCEVVRGVKTAPPPPPPPPQGSSASTPTAAAAAGSCYRGLLPRATRRQLHLLRRRCRSDDFGFRSNYIREDCTQGGYRDGRLGSIQVPDRRERCVLVRWHRDGNEKDHRHIRGRSDGTLRRNGRDRHHHDEQRVRLRGHALQLLEWSAGPGPRSWFRNLRDAVHARRRRAEASRVHDGRRRPLTPSAQGGPTRIRKSRAPAARARGRAGGTGARARRTRALRR